MSILAPTLSIVLRTFRKVPSICNCRADRWSALLFARRREKILSLGRFAGARSGFAAFRVLAAIMLVAAVGCTTATERLEERKNLSGPYSRVFYANYEDVEIALKQSMIRYPQKVDNTEAGIFETDFIKGEARFKSPMEPGPLSPGYRYRLLVRLVRGRSEDKPAIKVQITKRAEILRDFFSEPINQKSDGLEEQVILYRIGRELQLARAIAKANEKANKKNQP